MICVYKLKETNSLVSPSQHVAVLYYEKYYLSRTQIFKNCNTIANICVGLDVNILHCVEGQGLTDPLVLPCVLNVTPYLKSATVGHKCNNYIAPHFTVTILREGSSLC